MIQGIEFDEQVIKAVDMAHFMRKFSRDSNGITRGCAITSDTDNMYIAEGYMLIQGRQIKIVGTHTIELNKVTTGELYCRVVIEIDLSKSNTETANNQLSIKTLTSSSGYPSVTQQDLEDNPTGKYQYLVAQYHTSTSGVDSFIAKAGEIDAEFITKTEFNGHFKLTGTDLYITT